LGFFGGGGGGLGVLHILHTGFVVGAGFAPVDFGVFEGGVVILGLEPGFCFCTDGDGGATAGFT
jgi:hypothetical protein